MATNNVSSSSSSGAGLATLLTVLFVALKLLHKIDWPWIWVVSPLWISFLLAVACIVIFFALAVIFVSVRDMRKRKEVRR